MTLTWIDFSFRLLTGFFLGVGIGIERQWLKTRSVLKTNVLVTLGAEMFVMLSIMTPGDSSPTRISAQVVSGIGFLGGGVILREGGNTRGINTAATLWCAAAVGTLVGSGYLIQAYLGTLAVVGANLLLRPLESAFKQQRIVELNDQSPQSISEIDAELVSPSNTEQLYCCRVLCLAEDEAKVLALLVKFARERKWRLTSLGSRNLEDMSQVEVKVNFGSSKISDEELENLEQVVSLLKSEVKVNSVDWQFSGQDIFNK